MGICINTATVSSTTGAGVAVTSGARVYQLLSEMRVGSVDLIGRDGYTAIKCTIVTKHDDNIN